jgi:hypothetical protein
MDVSRIQEDVLEGLLSGDPTKAEATAMRIYTEDAVFKHPLFLLKGRANIATLWAWWNNMQKHMAPKPGLTQLWISNEGYSSVVLDLTYEAVPFWSFFLQRKHVARIVVLLHLVELECPKGELPLYKIRRQEDFIQDDSAISALLPQPFGTPAVMLARGIMWLWGLCIIHIFSPLMVEVRAFL